MSVEKYAALELGCGARLTRTGTRWWRRVRPCFYRPLLPFEELSPAQAILPACARLGGAQHLVPFGAPSNSHMKFVLFEQPQAYGLAALKKELRYQIRRAQKTFVTRPLLSAEELAARGHAVYLSFYERTQYGFRADRVRAAEFGLWAELLFRFPEVLVLGAFENGELVGVGVSYLVSGVVFFATMFTKTEALANHVSDLILHDIRERAACLPEVRFVFAGMAGGEPGVEAFYALRGANVVARPALLTGNSLALFFVRACLKQRYVRLLGGG